MFPAQHQFDFFDSDARDGDLDFWCQLSGVSLLQNTDQLSLLNDLVSGYLHCRIGSICTKYFGQGQR